MLERRRCHPLYIVERLFGLLVPILLYIFFSISGALEEGDIVALPFSASVILYVIISVLGFIALLALLFWISWRNIWISAEDNNLIYESGVFVKKRVTIPFSKINTIDMGRNLFQRLVGTCRLKVDTGAIDNGANNNAEMNIVFSLKDAEEFRSYILNRSAQDESELRASGATAIMAESEPKWVARARFSDFLLYGLTSSSVAKLFGWVVLALCFLAEISTSILMTAGEFIMPYAEAFWGFLSGHGLVLLIVLVLLIAVAISLAANLVSVAYAALRFFDFRVAREGDNVVVRYGLFTLKNYTVQAQNVHAVVVRQNLLQQIIGRCSVEMVSIGYGNEENETNLLFPIIEKKKLGWLLDTLLPEYTLANESYKPEKRSIRFLILRPVIWAALFFAIGLTVCWFIMDSIAMFVVAAVLLLIIIAVNGIMRYRGNALGCDGKVVLARSGGLNSTTHLIRVDAVQSMSKHTGFIQRRRKVASYHVDFHAPVLRNIAAVEHMNDDILPEIDKYIMK